MTLKSTTRLFLTLGALAFAPLVLSACDTATPDDETVAENPPPPYVDQTPPEQQAEIEIIPPIADPQQEIWRPGYWAMIGSGFTWIPGKIIPRPWPTAIWQSARWVHHSFGWSFQQGHWE